MLKAKISEIFQSLQGEGPYAGTRQVFVRFYGCNIRCVWCDTPYAIGDVPGRFEEYTEEKILGLVAGLKDGCHSVSLTGGEPLVQKDFIKSVLPRLKETGLKIYLETGGILSAQLEDIIDGVDIVAMDMKLPSSAKCAPYWKEHERFLRIALQKDVFIKAVVSSETTKEDVMTAAELVSRLGPDTVFILQPNFLEIRNGALGKCLEFQGDCLKVLPRVRVMPQMHKFMKLR